MKKKKVWIFGDSYAASSWKPGWDKNDWPLRIAEKYDVKNFASDGTGVKWSIDKLMKLTFEHLRYGEKTENITVIFFVSEYIGRPSFNFIDKEDQVHVFQALCVPDNYYGSEDHYVMKRKDEEYKQWFDEHLKEINSRYKKYKDFINQFYNYSNEYQDIFGGIYDSWNVNYISYYTLLKELSNQFNKMLVVPVQDTPHELIGKIKNTNKFMIAEGPQLRLHDEDSIDLPQPNHMRQENHDIMFNMLVDWIENNTVFNTEKLIKITHDYSNEHQDVFGGIYDSTK